ncbi:hypothetical protein YC2023_049399 [Brassica napus]
MRRRGELAIAQDGVDVESDGSVTKPSPTSQCNPNRRFSPSLSAPQPHMLNLLDECKASGIQRPNGRDVKSIVAKARTRVAGSTAVPPLPPSYERLV